MRALLGQRLTLQNPKKPSLALLALLWADDLAPWIMSPAHWVKHLAQLHICRRPLASEVGAGPS